MTPGAQVLVAKNSNIIYEKSFGKFKQQVLDGYLELLQLKDP